MVIDGRHNGGGYFRPSVDAGTIILLDKELAGLFMGVFRLELPGADWYVFAGEQLSELQRTWIQELAKEYGASGKMWKLRAYGRLVEGNNDLAEPAIIKSFGVVYANKAMVAVPDGFMLHVRATLNRVMWYADRPEYQIYSYQDRVRTYTAQAVDYEC